MWCSSCKCGSDAYSPKHDEETLMPKEPCRRCGKHVVLLDSNPFNAVHQRPRKDAVDQGEHEHTSKPKVRPPAEFKFDYGPAGIRAPGYVRALDEMG